VENRHEAVNHPRKAIVKLKSKKVRTAIERRFYRNEIAVRKNLTGQTTTDDFTFTEHCFYGIFDSLVISLRKSKQVWQGTIQNQPVFQKFIDDVRSGKKQMTTNLWINNLSAGQAWAEAERTVIRNNADALRDWGLWGLAIAALHVWVVFSVKKDLLKR
jgi:DNA invertase Pin-like site-specific DNA recombinase